MGEIYARVRNFSLDSPWKDTMGGTIFRPFQEWGWEQLMVPSVGVQIQEFNPGRGELGAITRCKRVGHEGLRDARFTDSDENRKTRSVLAFFCAGSAMVRWGGGAVGSKWCRGR